MKQLTIIAIIILLGGCEAERHKRIRPPRDLQLPAAGSKQPAPARAETESVATPPLVDGWDELAAAEQPVAGFEVPERLRKIHSRVYEVNEPVDKVREFYGQRSDRYQMTRLSSDASLVQPLSQSQKNKASVSSGEPAHAGSAVIRQTRTGGTRIILYPKGLGKRTKNVRPPIKRLPGYRFKPQPVNRKTAGPRLQKALSEWERTHPGQPFPD